jgi:predicted Zn-dependent peptidase
MYNLFTLNNGLRVIVEDIDYVNSISVGLWVENGSRNENAENSGISHFIEHMLFKGTENRTAKEIAECIEDVGGQINAFTGKEATCFYIKALDSHLELSLELLSDMLFNSKFAAEEIEKEKGVITEEISMSEDSPEDVLVDLHNKAIWGGDSISLPILGTVDTVKSFNREELLEYVQSHYIPENCVISIAGKLNIKSIEKLVEKYFGVWYREHKEVTHYSKPIISHKHLYKKKSIEQLHLSMGITGLETGNEDIYPLLILNSTFGGGASSILFQKVREEYGMCYSIYSYIAAYKNTGSVNIYTGLNASYAIDAVNLIKTEITKFSKEGISSEKLIKAKEQLKGNYILGLESTSSRMFNNGKSLLFLSIINKPSDIIKKIDNVNTSRLLDVMERTFAKGIQNSAFVGDNLDVNAIINTLEGDVIAFKNHESNRI